MAQEYFLDGNNDPVPTGDSYALRSKIDQWFLPFKGSCVWDIKTDDQKDNLIKAVTIKIDGKLPKGDKVDDTQPLNFPLENLTDEESQMKYYEIYDY